MRPVRREDVDAFLEFVGDDGTMRWIGERGGGRELAEKLVPRWVSRWEQNGVGPFAVLLDGKVIGRAGLLVYDTRTWQRSTYIDAGDRAVTELGWAITSSYWGHGYATESAAAVRAWVYAARGIDRLISTIEPRNVRSVRVAVKLGAEPTEMVDHGYGPSIVWDHPR